MVLEVNVIHTLLAAVGWNGIGSQYDMLLAALSLFICYMFAIVPVLHFNHLDSDFDLGCGK